MIGGTVIGIINLNSSSLPPLLVAFLFGYSADISLSGSTACLTSCACPARKHQTSVGILQSEHVPSGCKGECRPFEFCSAGI